MNEFVSKTLLKQQKILYTKNIQKEKPVWFDF